MTKINETHEMTHTLILYGVVFVILTLIFVIFCCLTAGSGHNPAIVLKSVT